MAEIFGLPTEPEKEKKKERKKPAPLPFSLYIEISAIINVKKPEKSSATYKAFLLYPKGKKTLQRKIAEGVVTRQALRMLLTISQALESNKKSEKELYDPNLFLMFYSPLYQEIEDLPPETREYRKLYQETDVAITNTIEYSFETPLSIWQILYAITGVDKTTTIAKRLEKILKELAKDETEEYREEIITKLMQEYSSFVAGEFYPKKVFVRIIPQLVTYELTEREESIINFTSSNPEVFLLVIESSDFVDYIYNDFSWLLPPKEIGEMREKIAKVLRRDILRDWLTKELFQKRRFSESEKKLINFLLSSLKTHLARKGKLEQLEKYLTVGDKEFKSYCFRFLLKILTQQYLSIQYAGLFENLEAEGKLPKLRNRLQELESFIEQSQLREHYERIESEVQETLTIPEGITYKTTVRKFVTFLRFLREILKIVRRRKVKEEFIKDTAKLINQIMQDKILSSVLPSGLIYRFRMNYLLSYLNRKDVQELETVKMLETINNVMERYGLKDKKTQETLKRVYYQMRRLMYLIFGKQYIDENRLDDHLATLLVSMINIAKSYYSRERWLAKLYETHELVERRRKQLKSPTLTTPIEEKSPLPRDFHKSEFYIRYVYLFLSHLMTHTTAHAAGFLFKFYAPLKFDIVDYDEAIKITGGCIRPEDLGQCSNIIPKGTINSEGCLTKIFLREFQELQLDKNTILGKFRLLPPPLPDIPEEQWKIFVEEKLKEYEDWYDTSIEEFIEQVKQKKEITIEELKRLCENIFKLTILDGLIDKALYYGLSTENWVVQLLLTDVFFNRSPLELLRYLITTPHEVELPLFSPRKEAEEQPPSGPQVEEVQAPPTAQTPQIETQPTQKPATYEEEELEELDTLEDIEDYLE